MIPRPDACTLCSFCAQVCPTHALFVRETRDETMLALSAGACVGCGKCVRVCEAKAMALIPDPSPEGGRERPSPLGRVSVQNTGGRGEGMILRRSPRGTCPTCGAPTVSRAELDYVAARLDHPDWLEYCPDCRTPPPSPHFAVQKWGERGGWEGRVGVGSDEGTNGG